MKHGDRSTDPNRYDSLAGTWSNTIGHYIRWYHETLTGECKIEWFNGGSVKTEYFSNYDYAQKRYYKLFTNLAS